MQSVSAPVLNRLDNLIEVFGLHDGEPPVQLGPLLENFAVRYAVMPRSIEAVTLREPRRRYVGMRFNADLAEWEASARRRHAEGHEWAHVFLRHRGDLWVMYRRDEAPGPFDSFLDGIQERQCDQVAAYLLVPQWVLFSWRDLTTVELALRCDVPVELVELRWAIWRKFNK